MAKAIEVNKLGKRYLRRELGVNRYQTLRDTLLGWKAKPKVNERDHFWALRHVDLEVEQGSILGVIGPNGAGKSTLLKLLSRVTAPTEGSFTLWGRVASLLEVGTGFHPELTGRENIFLSGTVMGMKRNEIKARFDEIVDFSGVEQFLDLPVKRYSSGMYVRLGFAIAAHLQAEILLVDEVLAVGDAAFQKKCLGKIGAVAQGGRTVLFVSHNLSAVKQLCEQSILVLNGSIVELDDTDTVVNKYLDNFYQHKPSHLPEKKKGVGEVRLIDVKINSTSVWESTNVVDGAKEMEIATTILVDDPRPLQINIGIYKEGIRLFTLQDVPIPQENKNADKVIRSKFVVAGNFLKTGDYMLGIGGNINGVAGDWFWSKDFCTLKVSNNHENPSNQALNFGVVNVNFKTMRF